MSAKVEVERKYFLVTFLPLWLPQHCQHPENPKLQGSFLSVILYNVELLCIYAEAHDA